MTLAATAPFTRQTLALDLAKLQHASPHGVYVSPLPDDPLVWTGVLFVRKGPYAHAILRFHIAFPPAYPARPPSITFLTDVFHPLVSPLTTHSYGSRDAAASPVNTANRARLPPGGFCLRHGFPEWFDDAPREADTADSVERGARPLTLELLQYLRVVFDTAAVLDALPLDAAANPGAWHAWRSHRSRLQPDSPCLSPSRVSSPRPGSDTPPQQPGGARRPAEWNWQGVWEERVRRCVHASGSDAVLYASDANQTIWFSPPDRDGESVADCWSARCN